MDTLRFVEGTDGLSPRLARVFTHWQAGARGRIAPARADIDPARLRADLAHLWLADVVDGGADFAFRLAGEKLKGFFAESYSNCKLSECPQTQFFANVGKVFRACATSARPVTVGPAATTYAPRDYLSIAVLVLPLSEDGVSVSKLFGAFEAAEAARAA